MEFPKVPNLSPESEERVAEIYGDYADALQKDRNTPKQPYLDRCTTEEEREDLLVIMNMEELLMFSADMKTDEKLFGEKAAWGDLFDRLRKLAEEEGDFDE